MAGGQERVLKRRIRSVESTKKITRAFELIAQSQIARAQARIAGTAEYAAGLKKALALCVSEAGQSITKPNPGDGSQAWANPANDAVLIVIAGDRGLCGGYNTMCLRRAENRLRELQSEGRHVNLITVGKKAESYFRYRHIQIEASYSKMSNRPTFEDARQIAAHLNYLLSGNVESVVEIVAWRFHSVVSQKLDTMRLLPLDRESFTAPVQDDGSVLTTESRFGNSLQSGLHGFSYFFEPEPEALLQIMLPVYLESDIFRALLESSAAEHTARQRAMAAATQNAEDLITTLRRRMNRVRQEAITTEIMEIIGGAEALRSLGESEDHGQDDLEIIKTRG